MQPNNKYPKKILTDVLEIYIIEANKAKEFSFKDNRTLDSWLKFINNPEEESQMENEEIKKAKKVLEEISQDEKERRMSELRQKYIMDQKAVYSQGYEYGKEAGIEQGIKQGIEQGIEQNKNDIAKKMKLQNIDIKTIAIVTGLTEEEILRIK